MKARVQRWLKRQLENVNRGGTRVCAPPTVEKAWMGTVVGKRFRPFDPDPDDIDIRTIARGLSMVCRYGGQVRRFYSVAEHCYNVSFYVPKELALYGLLHDSSEAFIGDMIRPIKHQPQMAEYRRAEKLIEEAVATHFKLEWTSERHAAVKEIDDRILIDEIKALSYMPDDYLKSPTLRDLKPLGFKLHNWKPEDAENLFLNRFEFLTGGKVERLPR